MSLNYYQILGVSEHANPKTIQKAFHRLAKELHPDKNPGDLVAAERFKHLSEAYKTLSHPGKKRQYDLKIKYGYTPAKPIKRPSRRPGPNFQKVHRTFSRQAKIMGGGAVAIIILVVLTTSFMLLRYNARYNFQRGISHYENRKYSAAYFNMKQSLGPFNPYTAAAHLIMADICYYQQADPVLTSGHIQKALAASPSDSVLANLYFLQGKLANEALQHEEAYRHFENSLDLLPNFDSARYQLGEMDTFVFKRYQKAIAHYQVLIDGNKNFFDAYLGIAYCNLNLNQYQKAINQIDRSLELRTDIGMAYYLKALSAQALDLHQIACDNFNRASELGLRVSPAVSDTSCNILEENTERLL